MPNESAKIILAVTNGKLSKVRDALAVEGTINALKCGFQFRTQDWDGTTKTAVFVRGRATPSTTNADITYIILDENNECDVPAEILEKDGMFSVGVFGESENYRIVSNWMCYKIADGCYADGSTPVDPGSSAYNQLIKMIKSKSDIGHNHADLYYTKDESEDRFVSQEELIGMITTPDWNQNDETANDYIKNKPTIPTTLAELSDDDAHRTVTDIEKSEWNEKVTNEEVDSKIAAIKPLIITVTQNETGDYIADKTFVEISTAIKSGQTAMLLDTTEKAFLPFVFLGEEVVAFGTSNVSSDAMDGDYYVIDVNDSITYQSDTLDKMPNPNSLIFTGAVSATYDGSNTVNVNIPQGVTNEEVDSKIAALVNSAPETLDTLNELAEALGNDPNFATTIATQLGNKVDKVDGKGLSTNDYTDEDKDKLSNISPSDWNQSNEMSSDYIKNKPTKLSQFENDSMFTTSDDISSITPSIGDNGNWFVGSVDTGVVAKGADGKGIKNISINDIVKDGFVTGKKCLTVIYSDDTKTEIQLPEIFNKDILIHEIDNGVCINYVDTNDVSEYNITNGRGIVSIDKTSTSGLVDTYTITYTDNTTSTFNVTNSVTKSDIEKLGSEVDTLKEVVGITTVSEENFSGLSSVEIDNLNEQSIDVELSTDNLILMPYDNNCSGTAPSTDTVVSANGVNFRANSDGSIDVWGTATKSTIYNMRNYYLSTTQTSRLTVDPGTYTIGIITNGMQGLTSTPIRLSTNLYTSTAIYEGSPATFSVSESKLCTVNLQITTGFTNIDESNPIRVYPILNLGSELKPYTCPKTKSINVSEIPSFPDVTLTVRKNDSNLSQVVVSGGALASINTSGATKVKLETNLPFIISVSNICISQNNKGALDQRLAIITSASVGTSPKSIIRQTLSDGESIELEETMAKKNKQLVFFAKVNTMGTLYIYHGENLYNSGWIQIDDTNLRVYTYDSTSHLRKEIEHGLTIKSYLGIVANTGNKNNLSIRVITDGGEFTVDNIYWSSSNGIIKAVSDGCSFTSVGMSWNCDDFKKNIWMYGDSYFDFQNAARWPYYMVQWGFDNCAAFGFPGAKSVDVYPEWQRTLQHGTPKYAIWCLGMNDVDSDTEINTEWKTYVDKFIEDCTSIGIEPILATIPNTPNRRHTYKNDYVKSSNRRYIDFADAVNASEYPASWFDGMLNTDNTHPLKEGAVALAIRAITDIPELVQQ